MATSTIQALLEYEAKTPAHFCLHLHAARCGAQTVLAEEFRITPEARWREFEDHASANRYVRVDVPPGRFVVTYSADVRLDTEPVAEMPEEAPLADLPDEVFRFLLPSRYCEADAIGEVAQRLFCDDRPGLARVQAIVRWIHRNIRYRPGSSTITTSALDVLESREGVCRDFAHLAIAFCRALNIPARFVAGYVWFDDPPQDFHAVFEAWLGDRWVMFDPTGMAPPQRLVRIGSGMDATDVAFATYFGEAELLRKEVIVLEHQARPQPQRPEHAAAQVL
ncbi:transglutaminase-like domain-containing protein [Ramlibacter sp. PS4R-6]|uniref:transglutaminase-like domain-containing protein n=1 Tax=Ramlibacter sp. PS4R-6 TaxID=3133438 RepID=UPI0030A81443